MAAAAAAPLDSIDAWINQQLAALPATSFITGDPFALDAKVVEDSAAAADARAAAAADRGIVESTATDDTELTTFAEWMSTQQAARAARHDELLGEADCLLARVAPHGSAGLRGDGADEGLNGHEVEEVEQQALPSAETAAAEPSETRVELPPQLSQYAQSRAAHRAARMARWREYERETQQRLQRGPRENEQQWLRREWTPPVSRSSACATVATEAVAALGVAPSGSMGQASPVTQTTEGKTANVARPESVGDVAQPTATVDADDWLREEMQRQRQAHAVLQERLAAVKNARRQGAALKIQAWLRGWRARTIYGALVLQAQHRAKMRRQHEIQKRNAAACCLQAVMRGFHVRHQHCQALTAIRHRIAQQQAARQQRLAAASVTLSRWWRGHVVRRRYKSAMQEARQRGRQKFREQQAAAAAERLAAEHHRQHEEQLRLAEERQRQEELRQAEAARRAAEAAEHLRRQQEEQARLELERQRRETERREQQRLQELRLAEDRARQQRLAAAAAAVLPATNRLEAWRKTFVEAKLGLMGGEDSAAAVLLALCRWLTAADHDRNCARERLYYGMECIEMGTSPVRPPFAGLATRTFALHSSSSKPWITVLSRCTNIQTLHLTSAALTTLTNLPYFTYLSEVSLSNNSLTDLRPLHGCRLLTKLVASHNYLQTVEGLAHWRLLSHLDLSGNKLAGPLDLSNNPALAQVKLRQCLLSEWLLLENDTLLPCLRELDLSGNRLTSLTSLMACPVLASLDISNNRFADAAGVAEALRCHVLFLERLSCTAHLWAPNELLPHLSSASMSNEGSIRLTPAAFAEDDWPAGGQRLKYLLESSRQSSSDSASAAGSVTQEMAFILQRWLCCLADWSTGPHNTQALVQRQAQKLSPPQPTAAQTAMMVSRVVRLQAWWRGTLVRLRLGRLLTTLDDGSGMGNSLVMEGDVDLSEFDAGLDAVDRDFGDLRPPTAILRKSRPAPVRAPATRVERAKVSAWATRDAPTPTELGELSDAKPALAANSRRTLPPVRPPSRQSRSASTDFSASEASDSRRSSVAASPLPAAASIPAGGAAPQGNRRVERMSQEWGFHNETTAKLALARAKRFQKPVEKKPARASLPRRSQTEAVASPLVRRDQDGSRIRAEMVKAALPSIASYLT